MKIQEMLKKMNMLFYFMTVFIHVGCCEQESAKTITRHLSQYSQSPVLALNVNVKQK
jgi:uncharacterized lipoprotein YajG